MFEVELAGCDTCTSTRFHIVHAGRVLSVELAGCDGEVKTDGQLASAVLDDAPRSTASGKLHRH